MSENAPRPEATSELKAAEQRLVEATIPFIPQLGLNSMSFEAGGKAAGFTRGERDLIAPNGASDIAALIWRSHDAVLTAPGMDETLAGMKIREKINHLINLRIDAFAREEQLAHRLVGFLMLPTHIDLHRRLIWETSDVIWRLAGDKALDENHYSKRTIVSSILAAALMTRLTRGADVQAEQVARNIDLVMQYEKAKAKFPFRPESALLSLASSLGKLRYGHIGKPADTGI